MGQRQRLKDKFVNIIIRDIIAGKYPAGSVLPSERELAEQLGMSRTVVRSGLAELSAIQLIETLDRKGSIVQDIQSNASLPVLNAILSSQGQLYPELMKGFLEARSLIELETARLAALNRSDEDLYQLYGIIRKEQKLPNGSELELAKFSFKFHRQIARASGNPIYPIFLSSMQPTYEVLLIQYYEQGITPKEMCVLHKSMYDAILSRQPEKAQEAMKNILTYKV
ncbi:MAG: FadR family transcriptional regulator [Ruminococcaceae bacterium]|nr:FadR family transcriptional regulator [Oscillospiraceae bacterium]